jgi:hypothetical protein
VILDQFNFSFKPYSRRFNFRSSTENNLFENRFETTSSTPEVSRRQTRSMSSKAHKTTSSSSHVHKATSSTPEAHETTSSTPEVSRRQTRSMSSKAHKTTSSSSHAHKATSSTPEVEISRPGSSNMTPFGPSVPPAVEDETKAPSVEGQKRIRVHQNRRKGRMLRNLRRRRMILYYRLCSKRKAAHHQVVRCVATKYKNVLWPHANVNQWVSKESKLSKESKNALMVNSLSALEKCCINRMESLAIRGKGRFPFCMYRTKDSWTSKTCPGCLNVNRNLGPSKLYTCSSSNAECRVQQSGGMHRDHVGALNTLLRYCSTSRE